MFETATVRRGRETYVPQDVLATVREGEARWLTNGEINERLRALPRREAGRHTGRPARTRATRQQIAIARERGRRASERP